MISLFTRAMISSTTRPALGSIFAARRSGAFFTAGLGAVSGVAGAMPGFSSAGVADLSCGSGRLGLAECPRTCPANRAWAGAVRRNCPARRGPWGQEQRAGKGHCQE